MRGLDFAYSISGSPFGLRQDIAMPDVRARVLSFNYLKKVALNM